MKLPLLALHYVDVCVVNLFRKLSSLSFKFPLQWYQHRFWRLITYSITIIFFSAFATSQLRNNRNPKQRMLQSCPQIANKYDTLTYIHTSATYTRKWPNKIRNSRHCLGFSINNSIEITCCENFEASYNFPNAKNLNPLLSMTSIHSFSISFAWSGH